MTKPTDILEEEHRVIEKVVAAMRNLADGLEAGRPVAAETLQEIVPFMRSFADRFHHGKEEDILFPLLAARGVPIHGCPIGALQYEHQQGRQLVGEFADAVAMYAADSDDPAPVVKALRALIELYPNHIWKEDYLLFPMTNKVLGVEDQEALAGQFQAADAAVGEDLPRHFLEVAERLEAGA